MLSETLQDTSIVFSSLLGVVLLLGLTLWLSGKRLARPACAVSGLLLGGLGGWWIGNQISDTGSLLLPIMVLAAIIGALLAAFLFRIWMGLSGAILLAVLVPAASLVWLGTTPQTAQNTQEIEQSPVDQDEQTTLDDVIELADGGVQGIWSKMTEAGRETYDQQAQLLRTWWDELGGAGRSLVMISALIGAGFGLLLGLIQPHFSASIQSAVIGAILIFFTGRQLLTSYLPDQTTWLPVSARGTLLTIGLITLAGLAIQWMLFHKRADKD